MKTIESKANSVLGLFFLLLVIAFSIPIARLIHFAYFPFHADLKDTNYTIEISKGESQGSITQELASKQIISDPKQFILLGKVLRQWNRIKAGEYEVSPSMTPVQIFSILASGVSIAHPITVREGANIYEIAKELLNKRLIQNTEQFVKLCRSREFIQSLEPFQTQPVSSLEGYLYPDTYFLTRTMSTQEIIKRMNRQFFTNWGDREEKRAKELGFTRHEAITLASMIEKETGAPHERPLISSVFHNRLRIKMRLQSDPTTIYGIWERYQGNLHRSDLQEKTPYNTYQIPALPVGPISNPGKESIDAALFPASSEFLYFVSHNDGTHEFSTNYKAHTQAVKKFQLDPNAKIGKSWRDLAKEKN